MPGVQHKADLNVYIDFPQSISRIWWRHFCHKDSLFSIMFHLDFKVRNVFVFSALRLLDYWDCWVKVHIFCEIFTLLLKISQNFVSFSEHMNFELTPIITRTSDLCLVILQVPKCFGLVQIFCARPKIYLHIVAVTNIFGQTKRWFAFSKIGFCAGTKVFEEALNAV